MIGRNDPCWCGSGDKWKKCHYPKDGPKHNIRLKTPEQIAGIRHACQVTAKILDSVCSMAKTGVTTLELDEYAQKLHRDANARAASLHYGSPPFPKSICTSLNDVICHGIPDHTILQEGDILNIDIASIVKGYYGDCSRMVCIGEVSPERKLVVDVAYQCLMKAIHTLKPGLPLSEIGTVISDYAEAHGCSVVHQFVGHGVGCAFHEEPQVYHHRNQSDVILMPGMTFTIEPMINAGSADGKVDPKDHWTFRTKDGKASAQWEHTLLVTEEGYEILTPWEIHVEEINSSSKIF